MDTKSSLSIILNPHAAKGKASKKKSEIEKILSEKGVSFVLKETTKETEAISLAYNATKEGYKTIIAAGGDGTVNEVVEGISRAVKEMAFSFEEIPSVGILPIGRGNDFAYIAKIPTDLNKAIELILTKKWVATDYGELFGGAFEEGRCFVNGVGIGFEPMVNFAASSYKNVNGHLSYILGFIEVLKNFPKPIDITIRGTKEEIHCQSQQISVCNGRRMGSMFLMAPLSEIDDGQFDIVYANKPIAKRTIFRYALSFIRGTQLKYEAFTLKRDTEVTISTKGEKSLAIHTDGEEVSRGCCSIMIKMYPGQLKLIRKF
ncbi:MAG: YegS/Rv2252/BmrU family lipid kinase [Sphaerochaetaceae bacterium]